MVRSPEQQFATAKALPIGELAKVLQGQSDIVDMSIAEMVLRQKVQAQKAQQGAQALPMAQSPRVVERDLAQAQQMMPQAAPQMPPQEIPQPRMEQGVAALPADVEVPEYAGGGIVAFDDGGPVRHFQVGGQSSPSFASSIGAPLQSTRVPGAGPTFASAFPNAAATASRIPGLASRIGMALNPMLMFEAFTGPSEEDVTRLREFDAAKEILKQVGFTDKDIAALSSQDIKRMAAGYVNRHTPPAAPTQTAPAESQTSAAPETPAVPALPKEKGIAALVAPKLPVPAELTAEQAGQERLDYYKSRGISEDPYKAYREALEKDRGTDAEARREAGWSRLLEAGLGIMGGESPYALTNIGKGAQAAAKGAAEDMKEFRKLERDRKKEEARLAIDQNNYLKSGADSDLAKVEKRRDTIAAIGLEQAKIDKDIYVANVTREIQALSRQDTREATLKATALKEAQDQVSDLLRRNPLLSTDPKFNYRAEIDAAYRDNLARLLQKGMPQPPAQASGPQGKVVNGVYVPAGR